MGNLVDSTLKEWNLQRRELFKKEILQVCKSGNLYWCCVGTWSVGCWLPGDKEKARRIIKTAFSTMQGLAKGISFKSCAKVMQLLS